MSKLSLSLNLWRCNTNAKWINSFYFLKITSFLKVYFIHKVIESCLESVFFTVCVFVLVKYALFLLIPLECLKQHKQAFCVFFCGLKCFCVLLFIYVFVRFFHFSISCLYLSYCVCRCHFVYLIKSLIVTLCLVCVIVCVCNNLSLKKCINILFLRFSQMIYYKTVNKNMKYFLQCTHRDENDIYIGNFSRWNF